MNTTSSELGGKGFGSGIMCGLSITSLHVVCIYEMVLVKLVTTAKLSRAIGVGHSQWDLPTTLFGWEMSEDWMRNFSLQFGASNART